MRQFFSTIINSLKGGLSSLWTRLSALQRIIGIALVAVLIAVLVVVSVISTRPDKTYLFTTPVSDVTLMNQITNKLDTENIEYSIDSDNKIIMKDTKTAQYARSMLVREDLIPKDTDPWELFDTQRWTQTDFERNVNLQRAIKKQVEQHIEALDDVDDAKVTIVMPEDSLFVEDRLPVTASVILKFKPGADFPNNRKKIEGVQKLILFAIEGLDEDNLVISDAQGVRLNDFVNLKDFDSLEQTKLELKIKQDYEKQYKKNIIDALSDIYTPDRVRIVNIDIEIDFSKKSEETVENFPILVKRDNPETPYDESEVVLSVPRSQEDISEKYEGTGYNPEGPPGVEGQTPPSYKDLDGVVGSWNHESKKINNEINQTKTTKESRPTVARVSASVAIDGLWKMEYNEQGEVIVLPGNNLSRTYYALTNSEISQALSLVKGAVGFSDLRGDIVSVENIQFDRTAQFAKEDQDFLRRRTIRNITIYAIIIISSIIVLVLLVRFLMRQIERAKARREERLAEQYRRMREAQILEMSNYDEADEESELDKLINEVKQIVGKNPEDVSALVRSWMEV